MRQLVLDLPVATRFGREDFLVSPSNEEAYRRLERWPDWPERFLHLQGPSGSGKSHLAAIWAGRAQAVTLPANAVGGEHLGELGQSAALVLEDLDRGPLDEPALFHLVNKLRETGAFLLLTSAAPLSSCGLATPDLISRLRLAPQVTIGAPDDALLRAVLVKLLLDRQLVVDTGVIEYIAQRIERSLARAAEIVAMLDREALSLNRRITRPVVAALLERQDMSAE